MNIETLIKVVSCIVDNSSQKPSELSSQFKISFQATYALLRIAVAANLLQKVGNPPTYREENY